MPTSPMTTIPTNVSFRGLAHSDAFDSDIRERVARLGQFYDGIERCRVRVEIVHRSHRAAGHVRVRIELAVPGQNIMVSHDPSPHGLLKDIGEEEHHKDWETEGEHRHAHVVIREAFDAATRRLQDFAREQRGAVKSH